MISMTLGIVCTWSGLISSSSVSSATAGMPQVRASSKPADIHVVL